MEPLKSQDPKSIGSWKLIGRLGSGGMGIVYLAEKNIQRVALKVVQNFMDSPEVRARLQREVELMGKIKSARVAKVIDSDVNSDFAWIATEFIDGPDLKTYVELGGVLNKQDWNGLALGLLQGLEEVHAEGIIHRDIKPSNILISKNGPKLIDFGIAQGTDATSLTSTGLVAGSPAWLAPEQIHGTPLTYATDLFSLGSVLIFAASGFSPWGEQTSTTTPVVFNRIMNKDPDLSTLTDQQKKLVTKLLEKDPQKRLKTNQALELLAQIQDNISTPTYTEKVNTEVGKPKKKIKFPIMVSIATTIIIATVAGTLALLGVERQTETQTQSTAITEVNETQTPTPTPTKELKTIEFREISSTGWTGEEERKVNESILESLQIISTSEWIYGSCEWPEVMKSIRSEGKFVEFQMYESEKEWLTIVAYNQSTGWKKFTNYSSCDNNTEKWEFFDPNFALNQSSFIDGCKRYRILLPETKSYVRSTYEWKACLI